MIITPHTFSAIWPVRSRISNFHDPFPQQSHKQENAVDFLAGPFILKISITRTSNFYLGHIRLNLSLTIYVRFPQMRLCILKCKSIKILKIALNPLQVWKTWYNDSCRWVVTEFCLKLLGWRAYGSIRKAKNHPWNHIELSERVSGTVSAIIM